MKDFNLKGYLRNKTLMRESYDSDKFGQTQDPDSYEKQKTSSTTATSSTSQNYDDFMDSAYGKDRFGQTQENKLKSKIDSSAMGRSKQAKAVGAWIESKGLTQDDFDELDMLIDDWFWVRKNEIDQSGWD